MKYWTLLLTPIFFFSLSATAQTSSLNGFLKLKTGKQVPDATVVIKELNISELTDEKGKFMFIEIPVGKYTIEVLSLGIKRETFNIEIKPNQKPITLEVERSEINLSEVTISANTKKKEIEVKGFAVSVIEPQNVATQSIQTNELLDRTAGVRIRQDGGMGSRINYSVNGLSGNTIKILIDGVPASNFGPSFSLNSIPPALIERIEVYKGVVPGHLSEDALGGAINIILKQRRPKTLMTSYSFGSFNTHQWNATGSYRWKKGLTIDGSAFYNYSDNNYKVWGKDIYFADYMGKITESNGKRVKRFHDAHKSLGARLNIGFTDVKWADQFLIGTVLSKNYNEVQHGITMLVVYGDRHTRRKSDVISLSYDKKNVLFEGLSLKIDATHSYLKRQVIDTVGIRYDWLGPIKHPDGSDIKHSSGAEVGNAKTAAINREHTNMLRSNLTYQINEKHTFIVNYLFNDFKRKVADQYQPSAFQKLANTKDLQKNILSFTYENLSFSDKLRTNIFYKHYFQKAISNEPYLENREYKLSKTREHMDKSGFGITFSYTLLPNLYVLASTEKALRLPSPDELFGNIGENILYAFPNLEPEKSHNTNIGVNYALSIAAQHLFNLNASLYYRDTKDMIREFILYGSFNYSHFENLESVISKGIDAELNYSFKDKLKFRFNVSKFDLIFNTKYNSEGHIYQYYGMQIRNEPTLKFNNNITYFHNNLFLKNSRASIYYNINYVNRFLRNWSNIGTRNLDYIPTQYTMDVGMTYTFPQKKVVISFDSKNIFDRQLFDNFGLQKPGRSFYTKLTYFIL